VYYRALEAANDCQRLKVLCRASCPMSSPTLDSNRSCYSALRAGRSAPLQALMRLAHRAFFAGTASVVWLTHRSVLRQGGYGARSFLRVCLSSVRLPLEPMNVTLASTSVP